MDIQIQSDYYRMTGIKYKSGFNSIVQFIFNHQLRYVFWWRKHIKRPSICTRAILYRYSRKYGLEISTSAEIGEGLYLEHPYNITVGNGVKIGKNVNLHKGCTLGRENRGSRTGSPTIGDNVYVGINATIVGNVLVGSNVLIAPGAFVNFDVPDNSIVIGNPGTIHYNKDAVEGYIAHRI